MDALYSNGVYRADAYDGATGGERIQRAVDAAERERERRVVVVPAMGPDEAGRWNLRRSIALPSNTLLVLEDCYLFLEAGSNDNLIVNKDQVTRQHDIHVLGLGKPRLDGNAANQERTDDRHMFGIHFARVDRFSFKNLAIGPTTAWSFCLEDVSQGEVDRIRFHQDGSQHNQDGVTIPGPADDIIITNIFGDTGDDSVALNAISGRGVPERKRLPRYDGGDVTNITIENVQTRVVDSGNTIRLLCGDGYAVKNIRIQGVKALPGSRASSAIAFGNARRYSAELPTHDEFTNIYAGGIFRPEGDGKRLIWLDSPVGLVQLSGLALGGAWSEAIFQAEDSGDVGLVKVSDMIVDGRAGEVGPVLSLNGRVNHLQVADVTVRRASSVLCGTGRVDQAVISGVSIYDSDAGFSFDGAMAGRVGNVYAPPGALRGDLAAKLPREVSFRDDG
jgi:hypothetical protein